MSFKMSVPVSEAEFLSRNEVHLLGRVSKIATEKVMPSGDQVVEFRLIVDRKKSRSQKREVDTLDIAVWGSRNRKRVLTLIPGEWVEIKGEVRRRFWKSPIGIASRWHIEASEVRRL
jgi:single-strand DNA-binding protein